MAHAGTAAVVRVMPAQLEFQVGGGMEQQAQVGNVRLENPSSSNTITFKLKTNRPNRYYVRPIIGLLAPGAAVDVEIHLLPLQGAVPEKSDKFLVASTFVAPGVSDPRLAWDSVNMNACHRQRIKCIFVDRTAASGVAMGGVQKPAGNAAPSGTTAGSERVLEAATEKQSQAPMHVEESGEPVRDSAAPLVEKNPLQMAAPVRDRTGGVPVEAVEVAGRAVSKPAEQGVHAEAAIPRPAPVEVPAVSGTPKGGTPATVSAAGSVAPQTSVDAEAIWRGSEARKRVDALMGGLAELRERVQLVAEDHVLEKNNVLRMHMELRRSVDGLSKRIVELDQKQRELLDKSGTPLSYMFVMAVVSVLVAVVVSYFF